MKVNHRYFEIFPRLSFIEKVTNLSLLMATIFPYTDLLVFSCDLGAGCGDGFVLIFFTIPSNFFGQIKTIFSPIILPYSVPPLSILEISILKPFLISD